MASQLTALVSSYKDLSNLSRGSAGRDEHEGTGL